MFAFQSAHIRSSTTTGLLRPPHLLAPGLHPAKVGAEAGQGPWHCAEICSPVHDRVAPTASTIATMALGDALAVVLSERRGFNLDQFASSHPGDSHIVAESGRTYVTDHAPVESHPTLLRACKARHRVQPAACPYRRMTARHNGECASAGGVLGQYVQARSQGGTSLSRKEGQINPLSKAPADNSYAAGSLQTQAATATAHAPVRGNRVLHQSPREGDLDRRFA
jgi:hypothetical protein